MSKILCGPSKDVTFPDLSLGQWMYKSLRDSPDDLKILIEGDTDRFITSKEFLQQACGFAKSLREYEVEKGDRVAIIGETSIDLNIAALGTILIGAVMCPFDPLLKSFEFQHLLKITKPKIVVSDNGILSEVQNALKKTFPLIPLISVGEDKKSSTNNVRFESLLQNVSVVDFIPAGCEDAKKELAVIVCSSGTTGLPKGVGLSQWSLAYQITIFRWIWPADTTLLHTSYFYWISGVLMFFSTTSIASKRVLVRTSEPTDSVKAIDKYKPAVAMLAPSLLSAMAFHPELCLYDISSLRMIFSGGSPVQKSSTEKLKEILPDCLVVQGYGCTELGGIISKTDASMDNMSVGILAENMKIKVVDRITGEVLGPNQDGELVCWSPTIMVGYYGNEIATKESFDKEGWFCTGDVGRYTEGGMIYITGRAKELMKVDNHQISPAEIEGVISEIEGVADTAVAGIDVKENTFPMALVCRRKGATVSENDIITAVADKLSDFKQLRAGVHFVEYIPRTSTGKLKRNLVQQIAKSLYENKM